MPNTTWMRLADQPENSRRERLGAGPPGDISIPACSLNDETLSDMASGLTAPWLDVDSLGFAQKSLYKLAISVQNRLGLRGCGAGPRRQLAPSRHAFCHMTKCGLSAM